MINAVYNKTEHRLTVKGHAQSGEKGHDLVCAAASMIVYQLAEDVMRLCEDKSKVRRPKIKLEEGNAVIACSPIHGMQAITTLIFDSVCVGFEILQRKYPENVSFQVLG